MTRTLKNPIDFRKITTKCGEQFNKDYLTVAAFTIPDFSTSSTSYVLYRSGYQEFILCLNHYDAEKDYINSHYEVLGEREARPYLSSQSSQRGQRV